MGKSEAPFHYVCTLDQAETIIKRHKKFWVSKCGCREKRGNRCKRSRIDVCLYFTGTFGSSGTGFRRAARREAIAILALARREHLVARPYPNAKLKKPLEGICFCCDDCCAYFLNPKEECDKGKDIEKTDLKRCTACGDCVKVCYFGARLVRRKKLTLRRARCYGCGLCVDVCPETCISMGPRVTR